MTIINFRVTDASGAPVKGAIVDIALPEVGVVIAPPSLVLPTTIKGTTNSSGDFTTPAPGLQPISTVPYYAVVFDPNTRRRGIYEFFVPDVPGIHQAADLALLPKPSPTTYDAIAIAKIGNLKAETQIIADQVAGIGLARYNEDFVLNFVAGEAVLDPSHTNSFLIIDESVGTIIVPDGTGMPIGTSIVFIKGKLFPGDIAVTFEAAPGVALEPLSNTVSGYTLQNSTDVFTLVYIGLNPTAPYAPTWKLYNTGGSGSGGGNNNLAIDIADANTNINDNTLAIASLDVWRTSMNTLQNTLSDTVSSHTISILGIVNTISALTLGLVSINQTIEEKVFDAIPGVGDISASVTASAASAAAANTSQITASAAENVSVIQAGLASNSAVNAALSETNVNLLIDNTSATVETIADLKAIPSIILTSPLSTIRHAYVEGETAQGGGGNKRYFYAPASLAVSDIVAPFYVVRPDNVPDDLSPGRWIHLPISSDQFVDNTLDGIKILDGSIANTKMADISAQSFIGRQLGVGTGAPQVMTRDEARAALVLGSNAYDNGYPSFASSIPNATYGSTYRWKHFPIRHGESTGQRDFFRINRGGTFGIVFYSEDGIRFSLYRSDDTAGGTGTLLMNNVNYGSGGIPIGTVHSIPLTAGNYRIDNLRGYSPNATLTAGIIICTGNDTIVPPIS